MSLMNPGCGDREERAFLKAKTWKRRKNCTHTLILLLQMWGGAGKLQEGVAAVLVDGAVGVLVGRKAAGRQGNKLKDVMPTCCTFPTEQTSCHPRQAGSTCL